MNTIIAGFVVLMAVGLALLVLSVVMAVLKKGRICLYLCYDSKLSFDNYHFGNICFKSPIFFKVKIKGISFFISLNKRYSDIVIYGIAFYRKNCEVSYGWQT